MNPMLTPKLEKDDKNYKNFQKDASILTFFSQINMDNNFNIIVHYYINLSKNFIDHFSK